MSVTHSAYLLSSLPREPKKVETYADGRAVVVELGEFPIIDGSVLALPAPDAQVLIHLLTLALAEVRPSE